MNDYEIMTSGFFSWEDQDTDPSDNNEMQRMMQDNALTSIILNEESAVAIMEAYTDLKKEEEYMSESDASSIRTKTFTIEQKFLEDTYDVIKKENIIVDSNGNFSVDGISTIADDVKFCMDSDGGARLISCVTAASTLNFVQNTSFNQIFLCDNAFQAKDIIKRLNAGDDSIFDSDLNVAWVDNKGEIWGSASDDSVKYAVNTNQELYKIDNNKVFKKNSENNIDSDMSL